MALILTTSARCRTLRTSQTHRIPLLQKGTNFAYVPYFHYIFNLQLVSDTKVFALGITHVGTNIQEAGTCLV